MRRSAPQERWEGEAERNPRGGSSFRSIERQACLSARSLSGWRRGKEYRACESSTSWGESEVTKSSRGHREVSENSTERDETHEGGAWPRVEASQPGKISRSVAVSREKALSRSETSSESIETLHSLKQRLKEAPFRVSAEGEARKTEGESSRLGSADTDFPSGEKAERPGPSTIIFRTD